MGIEVPANVRQMMADASPCFDALDLMTIADLLSVARLVDPMISMEWACSNIPERLIARIPLEIPWAGPVSVEAVPEGRLLRSSIFHVAHSVQTDIHKDVVQLCTLLLGLDQQSLWLLSMLLLQVGFSLVLQIIPLHQSEFQEKTCHHQHYPNGISGG